VEVADQPQAAPAEIVRDGELVAVAQGLVWTADRAVRSETKSLVRRGVPTP
jgi:hypothetical protein